MTMGSKLQLIQTSAQQSFRYYLIVDGIHVAYISDVDRPSYTITTQEYKLLNYFFQYPMEIKWNSINFTVREVFSSRSENSVANTLMKKLRQAHQPPTGIDAEPLKNLSKRDLMNSMGGATVNGNKLGTVVKIQMLNPDGDVYEEWQLNGAFITDIKPSQLSYKSEELTGIGVTLSYDWAELIQKVA